MSLLCWSMYGNGACVSNLTKFNHMFVFFFSGKKKTFPTGDRFLCLSYLNCFDLSRLAGNVGRKSILAFSGSWYAVLITKVDTLTPWPPPPQKEKTLLPLVYDISIRIAINPTYRFYASECLHSLRCLGIRPSALKWCWFFCFSMLYDLRLLHYVNPLY